MGRPKRNAQYLKLNPKHKSSSSLRLISNDKRESSNRHLTIVTKRTQVYCRSCHRHCIKKKKETEDDKPFDRIICILPRPDLIRSTACVSCQFNLDESKDVDTDLNHQWRWIQRQRECRWFGRSNVEELIHTKAPFRLSGNTINRINKFIDLHLIHRGQEKPKLYQSHISNFTHDYRDQATTMHSL